MGWTSTYRYIVSITEQTVNNIFFLRGLSANEGSMHVVEFVAIREMIKKNISTSLIGV